MADVTVTVNNLTAINANAEVTASPATEDTITTAQKFNITPTKAGHALLLTMGIAGVNGKVTYSAAAGMLGKEIAGEIPEGKTVALVLDDGFVKDKSGVIAITFTPATGKTLKTNHALTVTAVQLPA